MNLAISHSPTMVSPIPIVSVVLIHLVGARPQPSRFIVSPIFLWTTRALFFQFRSQQNVESLSR